MEIDWLKFNDPFEYPDYQTEEMCLAAVKSNGHALEYIEESLQTHEICLAAVRDNGIVLESCFFHSDEICLAAVKNEPYALESSNIQTSKICIAALEACCSIKTGRRHTNVLKMIDIPLEGELLKAINRIKLLGQWKT